MCIAYAQTADPTAAFLTYAFLLMDSNDYMKFGIWPDGMYMSVFETVARAELPGLRSGTGHNDVLVRSALRQPERRGDKA